MKLLDKLKRKLRPRLPTPEELAERKEADAIRDQMLSDRASQVGYRPGSR